MENKANSSGGGGSSDIKRKREEDTEDNDLNGEGGSLDEKDIEENDFPNCQGHFSIKWSFEQVLGKWNDQSDTNKYVQHYTGVLWYNFDEKQMRAGEIVLYKIKTHNIGNDGKTEHEILDPITEELGEVGLLIHRLSDSRPMKNMGLDKLIKSAELINNTDAEDMEGDVVYIKRVHVRKKYRGHGLGLFMVDAAATVINSVVGLTLLKPFPLQHETCNSSQTSNDYQSTDIPLELAKEKLVRYFKKLGFAELELLGIKYLGRTNAFVLDDVTTVAPQLKKLI